MTNQPPPPTGSSPSHLSQISRLRAAFKPRRIILAGVLLWAALLSFGANFYLSEQRNIFKDEAIELLQSVDLPTNGFYFFAPAHKDAWADFVEAGGIYLNRLFLTADLHDLRFLKTFHVFVFTLATLIIYLSLRKAFTAEAAFWGALGFCTSSLNLFYNQVLTRNYLSPLISGAILFCVLKGFSGVNLKKQVFWTVAGAGAALVLGTFSYSAFRPLAIALCAALVLYAFVFSEFRLAAVLQGIGLAVLLALGLGLSIGVLLWLSNTPFELFLKRGNYAVAPAAMMLKHVWLTIISPIFLTRNGAFIIDETHWSFAQAYLSWPLAGFYILGLVRGMFALGQNNRQANFIICWTTLAAQTILAAGGPSVKYTYALFPFYVYIAFSGVDACLRLIKHGCHREVSTRMFSASVSLPGLPPGQRLYTALGALRGLVLLSLFLDLGHLCSRPVFLSYPQNDPGAYVTAHHYQNVHRLAIDTATRAIKLASLKPEARIFTRSIWGPEIVFWMIRPYPGISKVFSPENLEAMSALHKEKEQFLVINDAMDWTEIENFKITAARLNIKLHIVTSLVPSYLGPVPQ